MLFRITPTNQISDIDAARSMMTVWLSSLIALLCVKQDYADLGKITLCDWDKKSEQRRRLNMRRRCV